MNYQDFCIYIKDNIKDYLPGRYEDCEVELKSTVKNNSVKKQGIVLNVPGTYLTPVMYLEQLYDMYDDGYSLDSLCEVAAERYNNLIENPEVSIIDFKDYDSVKDKILPVVISAKDNKCLLNDRPHKRIDDLAVTYQIEMERVDDSVGTVAVGNGMMEVWGVTTDEIHNAAIENQKEKYPPSLCKMEDILFGVPTNFLETGELIKDDTPEMYVLKSGREVYGAAVISDPVVMEDVSKVLDDSFIILPSSVHECIILPQKACIEAGFNPKELGKMVREVNSGEVNKEERLSDHVYSYSKETKMIESIKESKNRSVDMER